MEKADIVIIGGGIVGSSIAWHLTEAGAKNVLVLERESHQGKGSTGKSMGGVRAQFSSEINIRLSMYSIPFYADFEWRMDHPSGYRPQGYLFLAMEQKHLDYLRTNVALQQSCGLKTVRLVETDEVRREYPQLVADDIIGGSFCSTDGFVDPYMSMTGFMQRASEQGARIWKDAEVTVIEKDGNGICAVVTKKGRVETRNVVIACGAWSRPVARMVGVDLPVEPLRRMLVPSEPFDKYPHSAPMTIDMSTGFHFRPEGRGFLLAWNDVDETYGDKQWFEPSFLEKVLNHAAARVTCFENLPVNPKRAWAGLYEMTPDHHPVLGPVRNVKGLYIATGFSGHGVMHAPATGKLISEYILQGKPELVDASVFAVERFVEGKLIHETAVL